MALMFCVIAYISVETEEIDTTEGTDEEFIPNMKSTSKHPKERHQPHTFQSHLNDKAD